MRQQLILPFVLTVGFVALAIGWVSFQATAEAVGALTQRVLLDMACRVSGMTSSYLAAARTTLDAAATDGLAPHETGFSDSLSTLEDRFWDLSKRASAAAKYVYFGGEDGRFVGVNRVDHDFVELYLRKPGAVRRYVYGVTAPGDRSRQLRSDEYDPRRRP